MKITISTHFGSTVSLAHNRREPHMIDNENRKWAEKYPGEVRIDTSGYFEILKDEGSLNQVYHQIFDEAVAEWNERQMKKGNKDRCITNYFSELKAKENKSETARHPVYELIVGVGSKDNPIVKTTACKMLKDFYRDFEQRNPNLHVVLAALHADETSPHLHISVIPVAYNMNRGMHTQNSIKNALIQQGFESNSKFDNAETKWIKSENQILENICGNYGFEVDHYMAGKKVEHLSDEEFKLKKRVEELQTKLEKTKELPAGMTMVKKARLEQLQETEKAYQENMPKIEQANRDLKAATTTMEAYSKAYTQLQKDKENFEEKVNEAANKKIELIKDKAIEFIKSVGMLDKFLEWTKTIVKKATENFRI